MRLIRIILKLIRAMYVLAILPVGLFLMFFVVAFPIPGVTSKDHFEAWSIVWIWLIVATIFIVSFKHFIFYLTKMFHLF